MGADGSPAPLYDTCTPVRQGITEGWIASAAPTEPTAQSSLADFDDGVYAIVTRIDPRGRILEADDSDNLTETIVQVSGGATVAEVMARQYP